MINDLDARVEAAQKAYADRHPLSRQWFERALRVMPGGNTRSVLHFDPFPIRVTRAETAIIHDVDGHQYVDLAGNYTAGLFGHSPAAIVDAVHGALGRGIALGAPHGDEVRLAELVVDRFPSVERVRFTNSGTEANLMALAAALHHTGRTGVVIFDGAYHGGVLTFGRSGRAVNVPHRWLPATYNDLASVERVFARDGDVACILVEPMQGSAGGIAGRPEFLAGLRHLANAHGAVLIFDEVMTSRLAPGGLQSAVEVIPDLTTLGKYLAGGMSFGAFGGGASIMAAFDPSAGGDLAHAGTFNNNVITMAAGVAALGALDDDTLADLNRRGDRLRMELNETFDHHGIPMCATGLGSIIGVHPVAGPVASIDDLATADRRVRQMWFFASLAAGFFVAPRGFLALSIEITDAQVAAYLDAVAEWCSTLS